MDVKHVASLHFNVLQLQKPANSSHLQHLIFIDIGILLSVFYRILSQYFSQPLLLVVLCMPISVRSVCELLKCHSDIIKMSDGTLGFKLVAQCSSAKKHKQNCILLFGKRGPPNWVAKRQEITLCQSGKAHTVCNQLKHFVDPNHKIKRIDLVVWTQLKFSSQH